MSVARLWFAAVVVSMFVAGGCAEASRDDGGNRDAARGERSMLVVDPVDLGGRQFVEGSRTFLRVGGSDRWDEFRSHDGRVRVNLPAGSRTIEALLYVCSSRCDRDEAILDRVADGRAGDEVIRCQTDVTLEASREVLLRAALDRDGEKCDWSGPAPAPPMGNEPPDKRVHPQRAAPAWVESVHGAVWMQEGSSCWSFSGGGGCADSAGPSCDPAQDVGFHTPTLDVRPGERLSVHLGLEPTSATVTLDPAIASRDTVEPVVERAEGGRVLRFPAPDGDATLTLMIQHERGDASWFVCLASVGDARSGEEPTVVTGRGEHEITSELVAKRIFYGDGGGGIGGMLPETITCEEVDRPDLTDGRAWSCSALVGPVRSGKALRVSGIVIRDDGGLADLDQKAAEAPKDRFSATAVRLESATGWVELRRGTAPTRCDGPNPDPALEVYVGDLFAARVPAGTIEAELVLDNDGTGPPPRAAQDNLERNLLVTTLLKPNRRFVTVSTRTGSGIEMWHGCLMPARSV